MLKALRAKLSGGTLRRRLLDTKDATLVHFAPWDDFWGLPGRNRLGEMLMQLRDELRDAKENPR
jgi:predicted NAD-dependent protein-ADP-ribosyltransferase YbiA (DUF1768 family)